MKDCRNCAMLDIPLNEMPCHDCMDSVTYHFSEWRKRPNFIVQLFGLICLALCNLNIWSRNK